MRLWYFSFADDNSWLGGAYVEAASFEAAITRSHIEGFNPGGEIQAVEVPPDAVQLISAAQRNRLLKMHELGVPGDSGVEPWRA